MYTEASFRFRGNIALLLSPVLHTKSYSGVRGCVQFWFHMKGAHMGGLRVTVDGKRVWQRFGNQGSKWIPAAVPFIPANRFFQVRFFKRVV